MTVVSVEKQDVCLLSHLSKILPWSKVQPCWSNFVFGERKQKSIQEHIEILLASPTFFVFPLLCFTFWHFLLYFWDYNINTSFCSSLSFFQSFQYIPPCSFSTPQPLLFINCLTCIIRICIYIYISKSSLLSMYITCIHVISQLICSSLEKTISPILSLFFISTKCLLAFFTCSERTGVIFHMFLWI